MCFSVADWFRTGARTSRRTFLRCGLMAGVAAASFEYGRSHALAGVAEGGRRRVADQKGGQIDPSARVHRVLRTTWPSGPPLSEAGYTIPGTDTGHASTSESAPKSR